MSSILSNFLGAPLASSTPIPPALPAVSAPAAAPSILNEHHLNPARRACCAYHITLDELDQCRAVCHKFSRPCCDAHRSTNDGNLQRPVYYLRIQRRFEKLVGYANHMKQQALYARSRFHPENCHSPEMFQCTKKIMKAMEHLIRRLKKLKVMILGFYRHANRYEQQLGHQPKRRIPIVRQVTFPETVPLFDHAPSLVTSNRILPLHERPGRRVLSFQIDGPPRNRR